jgi:hypothetical protein
VKTFVLYAAANTNLFNLQVLSYPEISFELKRLRFIALVRSRNTSEALRYAVEDLTPFSRMDRYRESVEDCLTLLAYDRVCFFSFFCFTCFLNYSNLFI